METRAAEAPIVAKWESHIVKFRYNGFTTYYTCDGLRDALRRVLIAAGAREDVKVQVTCPGSHYQAFAFLHALVGFSTLHATDGPVTDETIPAAWTPMRMSHRKPRDIERGDCELIEQFAEQILPLFAARDVEDNTVCTPRTGGWPKLQFTVLRPVEEGKPSPAPGAGPEAAHEPRANP